MTLADTNYNCHYCKLKYRGSQKRQDALFKQKACTFISENPSVKYTPNHSMKGSPKIVYYTCPANLKNIGTVDLINMSRAYKEGIMPYEGGIMQQPSKFVEVMDLVHNLIDEADKDKNETLKKYRR